MENDVEEVDICIVGGSIAGNYLCYLLSKSNLKIVVIEEHEEIGLPSHCAGIISKKLSQLIDLPKEIVLNRVNVAKIIAPSGKFIKLSGDEQPFVVNRISLDRLFYNKVKSNDNIRYILGEKFKNFKYIGKEQQRSIFVETSKRKFKTKMLIGCDGPLSSVGKLLGVKNTLLYGSQIRVKGTCDQKEAVMFFDPRWKELFGWIVPEGNNIYRIGLASSKNIATNFRLFLKKLNISTNQIIDQQGGTIPYGTMNKVAFDNALLLGDSACQVKATTGGGIVMLLSAAKHAAICVIKCFKQNTFSKKFIKRYYEKPCSATLGWQLKIHYILRIIFERFTNEDYETFFQIIKTSKIEQIISFYGDMDFPKSIFFKLLKNPLVMHFLLRFIRKNPLILVNVFKIILK